MDSREGSPQEPDEMQHATSSSELRSFSESVKSRLAAASSRYVCCISFNPNTNVRTSNELEKFLIELFPKPVECINPFLFYKICC